MVWESNAPNGGFSAAKPWLPIPAEHIPRAANREAGDPSSVLGAYKQLLAFRRDHEALRTGSIELLDAPQDVLAFVRASSGERLLCVFNLGSSEQTFVLPPGLPVVPLAGHGFTGTLVDRKVRVGPGDALFLAIG
jgi:alpha-glucosidase